MKFAVLLFLLVALLPAASVRAQEAAAASAPRVQLADGRVSFVPPAGFKLMSKEDINFKFGRNGAAYAPEIVYTNERQNVSVAITFAPARVTPEQLDDFQKAMEKSLEASIERLEWLAREQVTLKGVRWIHLSLKSGALDTDVYNEMYMTPLGPKVLMFNFNSTVAQYERHREALRKSAETITVKP
ncbi:MAG TPA: hypothetical protein VER76_15550 [Pyrinomonadaceae bacterium]|nr:hypothetical protein [Pyrinomonadaceae bacterium]